MGSNTSSNTQGQCQQCDRNVSCAGLCPLSPAPDFDGASPLGSYGASMNASQQGSPYAMGSMNNFSNPAGSRVGGAFMNSAAMFSDASGLASQMSPTASSPLPMASQMSRNSGVQDPAASMGPLSSMVSAVMGPAAPASAMSSAVMGTQGATGSYVMRSQGQMGSTAMASQGQMGSSAFGNMASAMGTPAASMMQSQAGYGSSMGQAPVFGSMGSTGLGGPPLLEGPQANPKCCCC